MVSLLQRMRRMKTLLSIRLGPGAIILPKNVERLHMDFALKTYDGHKGPRKFWRHMLPRLKYHNPRIPMTVNRTAEQTGPATLSIFLTRTTAPTQKELLDQENPNATTTIDSPETPSAPLLPSESLPDTFQPLRYLEPQDDDGLRGKTRGPSPTQRVIEVAMKHKSEDEILADMLKVTGGQEVQPTQGELDTLKELEDFRERSRRDSVRSKEVRAKWKREQEMLRLAKGEAA